MNVSTILHGDNGGNKMIFYYMLKVVKKNNVNMSKSIEVK